MNTGQWLVSYFMFALFPYGFIEGRLHSSWPLTPKYPSVFLRTRIVPCVVTAQLRWVTQPCPPSVVLPYRIPSRALLPRLLCFFYCQMSLLHLLSFTKLACLKNAILSLFLIFIFITFVRSFVRSLVCRCVLHMCMCWGCEHARAPMWRSEDHLQNLGLSLHRGGPRPCTPVKRPLLSAPLERARFPVCASVVSIELLLSYPESGMGGSVPSLRTTSGGPQLSVPHLPGECVFSTPRLA